MQHLGVGADPRPAMPGRTEPESGEIHGEHPGALREDRCDPDPVEMRAAEAVNHDHRKGSGVGTVFDPVDGTVDVDDAAGAAPLLRELLPGRFADSVRIHHVSVRSDCWRIEATGQSTAHAPAGA